MFIGHFAVALAAKRAAPAVSLGTLVMAVAWGYWIDRHRKVAGA